MAVELATAYISLVPSTRGFGAAMSGQLQSPLATVGKEGGASLGTSLIGGLKKVGLPLAIGAGAAIFGAFASGWGRLTQIEDAQAKLKGLGYSGNDVKQIMKDTEKSVLGTAFALNDAASVAAVLVASGIKPGKELQKTLATVGDTATQAGRSFGDMGDIFSTVAAKNKLQGDVLDQLQHAGIPILQDLAKEYGVTSAQAAQMVTDGSVDFAHFSHAMKTEFAGSALKAGKTTSGAFANAKTAITRVSADLLSGVFPSFKKFFNGISGFVRDVEPSVKAFSKAIGDFIGQNPGPVFAGIAAIVGGIAVAGIVAVVAALIGVTGAILGVAAVIGLVVGAAVWLWQNWDQVWNWIVGHPALALIISILAWPIAMFVLIVGGLKMLYENWDTIWASIQQVVQTVWDAIKPIVEGGMQVISGLIDFWTAVFKGHWGDAWNALGGIFSGAWKVVTGLVSAGWDFLQFVWGLGVGGLKAAWSGLWSGLGALATGAWDGVKSTIKGLINDAIGIMNAGIGALNAIKIHINFDTGVPGVPAVHFDWNGPNISKIPTLHTGGIFDSGYGEGFALLKDGEGVFTPAQMKSLGAMPAWAGGGPGGGHGVNVEQMTLTSIDPREVAKGVGRELLWAGKTGGH
jgi:tape measure domain-containing protein